MVSPFRLRTLFETTWFCVYFVLGDWDFMMCTGTAVRDHLKALVFDGCDIVYCQKKNKNKQTQRAGQLYTSRRTAMVGKRDWEIIIILLHLLNRFYTH